MKLRSLAVLLIVLVAGATTTIRASGGGPAAPVLLAPAAGATVVVPFTISWSAVTDPKGIVAYNWQVSPSSNFSPVILQNSTSGQTQSTVSGLANGTYFWRVQAVNGAFVQGSWSQTGSFNVSGAGPAAPAAPALGPPKGYSTFHPFEVMTFNWTTIAGASTYVLQASTDTNFPVATRIQFDNIPNPTMSFAIGNPEGNYWARVFAVDANGVFSQPSNLVPFSVFFDNPVPAPPSLLSPANGATLTVPVTFTWTDVPNPQPSGYELQVASDSGFANLEFFYNQITPPTKTVVSLTAGTKFWRVRSAQGDSSPTTAAVTAWSATSTFTVSQAPPTPVSVAFATNPVASGDSTVVSVQLSAAAPASGATIGLSSSNPAAAPVPATIAMPPNTAFTQFTIQAGQVSAPTPATITATLNAGSASGQLTVQPTALKSLSITPSSISGGAQAGAIVMLTGQAPSGGAAVTLSSNSPSVTPPASVFVNPGDFSVSFPLQTNAVAAATTATVTASWNGASTTAAVTVTPQVSPTSVVLSPTSTVGLGGSSFATVSVASPPATDQILQVASSNPTVASVPGSVTIPAGVTRGGFNVFTSSVTAQTIVTISVSGGGVTQSANLTVTPSAPPPSPPAPALSSISLNPSAVVGGNSTQGTATLTSAAPSGGAVVTLSSSNTAAAAVPGSATVPAGATSATFTVTTGAVPGSTPVTITGAFGGATQTATLTVTPASAPPPPPPPPGQTATLSLTASGRSGERITSTPAGISVAVGSTGSASFATGTSITLSVSNGRTAVWSGACSSGVEDAQTCTFTLNGNASVTANVQ